MIAAQSSDTSAMAVGGVVWILLTVLGLVFYFLPTIIAIVREHPNVAPIVVINVLLGWTLVGYAVALAWAFLAIDRDKHPSQRPSRRRGYGPANPFENESGGSESGNPFDFS
jgi:hypothetical protein